LGSPAPQNQTATAPNADQHLNDTQTAVWVENDLRAWLTSAGFTNIEMTPMSFLVRAKDAEGKTVILMLSPDSVSEFKPAVSQNGQDGSADSGAPLQQKF
jgi:hypothetical protein